MSPLAAMQRINELTSHVWMVRTFLKHSDEAQDDESLMETPRELYDFMLALGPSWSAQDPAEFLKLARKKYSKLKRASEHFTQVQPEASTHTNFQMAALSLATAVREIGEVLDNVDAAAG
jgi:hypothetical protein